MCPLFFSYDHPNYARYTSIYLLILLNLDISHPGAKQLLENNGFSVNRSDVPSSRNAVDITIEQTINRHAKSHGGIIGFSRNYAAYYRWCMTRHWRAGYLQATYEIAEMTDTESTSHKDVRLSEVKKSEEDVHRVTEAISNFINPFEIEEKEVLFCLSSGAPAPKEVEEDLLAAETRGTEAHTAFVKDRLVDKTKSFHDPIKRQNLKTFASLAKTVKVSGTENKSKQIKAERNVFGQLILLALEHNISMEKVLAYPLGPVPWSLATADGFPVKTDKSKLMNSIVPQTSLEQRPNLPRSTYIMDGNALYQSQVSIPKTFADLAESLFDQLPKSPRVDFVTDTYLPMSIKETERTRRGLLKSFLIQADLSVR